MTDTPKAVMTAAEKSEFDRMMRAISDLHVAETGVHQSHRQDKQSDQSPGGSDAEKSRQ